MPQETPPSSKPRYRWGLRIAVAIFCAASFFVYSAQRSAHRRYEDAVSLLEKKNTPLSLDDLASRQKASPNAADLRLAAIYPVADRINARMLRLYDDQRVTAKGEAEMEKLSREHPDLLAKVLEISESRTYWSRRRFDGFEDLNRISEDEFEQHSVAVSRYLQHVFFYAQQRDDVSTAVHAATAILRLSNLLAEQPLTDQCYASYVLRGMSLRLFVFLLESSQLSESQQREVRDSLAQHDADETYAAMLETERAVIISEYESGGPGPVFGVHAVVALLEFIETSTMPNGTIGKVSIGIHHGEFITDRNTLDDFRSKLCDLEQHALNMLDRTETRRICGESATSGP